MKMRRIPQLAGAVIALIVAIPQPVSAQSFPTKPIRILVPFPAGGPSDFAGRVISQKLPELLGQPIVYDNRAGAAGAIAAQLVAQAPADGHTLLIANVGMLCIAPRLGKIPYDPARDFTPITNLVSAPQWLVVHPSVPVRNVQQLITFAKAKPGQLTYGSAGVGQQSHLTGELFKIATGVDILHVPYKGATPAMIDLLGGQITMGFTTSIENFVQGRLRILAITSRERSRVTPDVPTMIESGVKDFEAYSWNGILAPAATPRAVVARLNRDIAKALQLPEVRERVGASGKFVVGDSPEEFAAYIRSESAKWAGIVKRLGLDKQ